MNDNVKRMEVYSVLKCSSDGSSFMAMLKETDGERMLPIIMEHTNAILLTLKMKKVPLSSFPLSMADIMHETFKQCNMSVEEVRIAAVQAGITYCHILYKEGTSFHMLRYCRASDGLIIAYTFGCPITIFESLLEKQYMRQLGDGVYSIPANTVSLEVLKEALKRAVEDENYEIAARLRDEIKRRK